MGERRIWGPWLVQVFDGVEEDKGQDKKTSEEVSGCDEPWKRWRPGNVQAPVHVSRPPAPCGPCEAWTNRHKGSDKKFFL